MEITQLLELNHLAVGVQASDKVELINSVVDLLAGDPAIKDLEVVRRAVLEREESMSTAVGKGLALPHAKTSSVTGVTVALAITKEPVDFHALDNEPVRIVFLLVGRQDSKSQHVRILSRISRMMNRDENRRLFLEAQSAEELLPRVKEAEARLN
ncbi:MAG: PTS sugar transporter subunit IIA [Bacteroidetes bacterium]|nr:PTS sugar transporter subunit IIA [Bacteroidota bacterium]